MISTYRKKPLVVEALQWTGFNLDEVIGFCPVIQVETELLVDRFPELFICTPEGEMHVSLNDFIIKGVRGEFYACKPDVFWETYDSF